MLLSDLGLSQRLQNEGDATFDEGLLLLGPTSLIFEKRTQGECIDRAPL